MKTVLLTLSIFLLASFASFAQTTTDTIKAAPAKDVTTDKAGKDNKVKADKDNQDKGNADKADKDKKDNTEKMMNAEEKSKGNAYSGKGEGAKKDLVEADKNEKGDKNAKKDKKEKKPKKAKK